MMKLGKSPRAGERRTSAWSVPRWFRQQLKFGLLLIASVAGAVAASQKEKPVVMAEVVVFGKKIPSGWFTIASETRGPLPLDRVKPAWVSNILPDGPAAKAGLKIGDVLVAIGETPVDTMSAMTLRWHLERERDAGAREEFVFQKPDGAKWVFVARFEK